MDKSVKHVADGHDHNHNHNHHEDHVSGAERLRDIVIGMSDGLTVPFALAAGLTGVIAQSQLVVTAGLAEIAAGSIAMGLGGYLAAKSEADHYYAEQARENQEIIDIPAAEEAEVIEIFSHYGVSPEDCAGVVKALKNNPEKWVDFMMRFELGLEKPVPGRAFQSAFLIATAYIVGGLVPLSPYFFVDGASSALLPSMVLTGIALAIFGYWKGKVTGLNKWKSGFQTFMIGGLAAAFAYFIASLFN